MSARYGIAGSVQYRIKKDHIKISGHNVHEDHRQKGVAEVLIDHIIKAWKKENFSFISLYTIKETGNLEIFKYYPDSFSQKINADLTLPGQI